MLTTTLKGLLAHRVRLAMTAIAIVLGVSFVAGTFVLTDTINHVFTNLVTDGTSGIDVVVRGDAAFTSINNGQTTERQDIPADVLARVRDVDGVAQAQGAVSGYAQIVDKDGNAITPMGPPTLGESWTDAPLGSLDLREGHRPQGDDQVAIDAGTADAHDLHVGDHVQIIFSQVPPRRFEIVGIATYGKANNLAGATMAVFDLPTAQHLLGHDGEYVNIDVAGDQGVTPAVLRDRIRAVLPGGVQAITATDYAAETTSQISDALGFFSIALGIFAAIALFVGAFIIANTFTIVVAQRTREFALLRALGASSRQVVASVIAEAAIVGLLASAVGVGAGVGIAALLSKVLAAFGMDLPTGALVVAPRTIVVGLTVGVVVTVLSSLLPARRASRVAPVAAMREVAAPVAPSSRIRTVAGAAMTVAGLGMLAFALIGNPDSAAALVGLAAALTLFGIGGLAPLIARPVAKAVGAPGARLGAPGRLARGNAMRSPRRTSATASALMIGLALVSFVAVLASSMKASAATGIAQRLRANVVLTSTNRMSGGGFTPVVADRLERLPEVGALARVEVGQAAVDGAPTMIAGISPDTWDQVDELDMASGAITDLSADDAVAVDSDTAAAQGLAVGDTVPMEFAAGGTRDMTLVAIYEKDALMSGSWITSVDTFVQNFADPLDQTVLIAAADGVSSERLQSAIAAVTADFPNVNVQDQSAFEDAVAGQVDQMLALVTALLGMAILISVLGITNTLALSVHERTRELGLLRAVGMTRRQVRAMVRWEAVIVAVLGALLGVVVGSGFGWAVVHALASQGIDEFVLPYGQLGVYVVLAALAGVVAALFPARRAAKLERPACRDGRVAAA